MNRTRYILDTNILVEAIRANRIWEHTKARYNPLMAEPRPVYCSVTEGELRSLAATFAWGPAKSEQMEYLLDYYEMMPIEGPGVMLAYAEIDSETNRAGRKMGKNDLWIAAVALADGLTLLTTDRDFDAVSPGFIRREWVDPNPL